MITRREFVTRAGMTAGATTIGAGLEGILAARRAPAYPQSTVRRVRLSYDSVTPDVAAGRSR